MNKNDYTHEEQQEILGDLFAAMDQKLIQNNDGTPIRWGSLKLNHPRVGETVKVKPVETLHVLWHGQVGTILSADKNYGYAVKLLNRQGIISTLSLSADEFEILSR